MAVCLCVSCARYAGLPRWGRVRKVDADAAEASLLLKEYGKAGKPKRVKDIYANAVVTMKSGTTAAKSSQSDSADEFALSNADMKAVTREVRAVDRHARFFFFLNGKSLIDDETNADLERAFASGQRGLIFNFASKLWRVDFDRMKMTNLLTGQSVIIEREASRPPALLKSAFPLEDSAYMEKHGLCVPSSIPRVVPVFFATSSSSSEVSPRLDWPMHVRVRCGCCAGTERCLNDTDQKSSKT